VNEAMVKWIADVAKLKASIQGRIVLKPDTLANVPYLVFEYTDNGWKIKKVSIDGVTEVPVNDDIELHDIRDKLRYRIECYERVISAIDKYLMYKS